MAQLFDKDGNEIEAFLPEEVEEIKRSERETAIAEANSLREEEINDLTKEKEELEKQITDYKAKETNLSKLRKFADAKEQKIAELESQIETVKADVARQVDEVKSSSLQEIKKEVVNSLAGKDEKLREKIEFYYSKFNGSPKSKDEVVEQVKNAFTLATNGRTPKVLSGGMTSAADGRVSIVSPDGDDKKLTNPEAVNVAKQMGLTDKDLTEFNLI